MKDKNKQIKGKVKEYLSFAKEGFAVFNQNHIQAYAAQAAYFVLISSIPLIMLSVIIVGSVIQINIEDVNLFITQFVPYGISDYAKVLADEIFAGVNGSVASVTTIVLLWAASNGVRSLARGFNVIFGSEKESLYIRSAATSLLYTVIFIFTITLTVIFLVFANQIEAVVKSFLNGKGAFILTILNLRVLIFFSALTFLFMVAYKTLAKSDISFFKQFFGAAFAAAGWILFSFGFSVYIKYFSGYTYLYGSLGAVMLFMLWLYMCMNIMLTGALINKLRAKNNRISE